MKFYTTIKKNEIMTCSGKWMQLEKISLSEICHLEEITLYLPSCVQNMYVYMCMCVCVCVPVCTIFTCACKS